MEIGSNAKKENLSNIAHGRVHESDVKLFSNRVFKPYLNFGSSSHNNRPDADNDESMQDINKEYLNETKVEEQVRPQDTHVELNKTGSPPCFFNNSTKILSTAVGPPLLVNGAVNNIIENQSVIRSTEFNKKILSNIGPNINDQQR